MAEINALELDEVCKSFGGVRAVDGLSARVEAGSIYGFLGPNGAGKTTTLRMIMNIIRPDSGAIRLFGRQTSAEVNPRVAYMPEERGLYRKMTARGILTYFGSLKEVPSQILAKRVPEWLERIELAAWADKRVEDLSRGMHQKLQFAVTVINEPDLLILDEPFSGLDPLNLDLIKSILLEMKARGKTVIFSTHGMHEAERLCDSILLINRGRNILDGPLEEIRQRYRSHAVQVELDGDGSFISRLPMVAGVESEHRQLTVTLLPESDPQAFLRALVDKAAIRRFELRTASLHEIFVQSVGASHAEDSHDRPARVR